MSTENNKQEIVTNNRDVLIHDEYFFAGPFPPPEILAKYEELSPGLVDRIFRYAELEQIQRHQIQNKQVDTGNFDVRSHFLAYCLVTVCITLMYIAMLAAGCYALHLGYLKTALAILAFPIARVMVSMTFMVRRNPKISKKTP